jgi:regulator of extracellular matrix RemA (YlzA/DUF370 family)
MLVHVGFGNFLAINRVLAIVVATSSGPEPTRRLIREAKKKGNLIDSTSGRRTKAAAIMDTGEIMLVAITPEAIAGRVAAMRSGRIGAAQAD